MYFYVRVSRVLPRTINDTLQSIRLVPEVGLSRAFVSLWHRDGVCCLSLVARQQDLSARLYVESDKPSPEEPYRSDSELWCRTRAHRQSRNMIQRTEARESIFLRGRELVCREQGRGRGVGCTFTDWRELLSLACLGDLVMALLADAATLFSAEGKNQ